MTIPKELIQQYANIKKISYDEAVSLIGETLEFIGTEEAESIVKECLEIIVRTVR